MRTNQIASRWPALLLGAITLLALAGCGGNQSSSSGAAAPTSAAVATMPPARFTAVAQQSALTRTVALTTTVAPVTTPVTATVTLAVTSTMTTTQTSTGATTDQTAGQASAQSPITAASAADLERGARSYERNQCASCHGEQGEGVAGRGGAIAGTPLSEREFENVLRTGGGLGNTHIFGPSAISPAGMGVLYAYVQSMP
jgi:mono/diheme cytochrome c family protein